MNIAEVRDGMLEGLAMPLKEHGFRTRKRDQCLRRPFEGGEHRIVLAIYEYRPMYRVAPFVSIRIDAIQQILDLFGEGSVRPFSAITMKLEPFANGPVEFEVRKEQDLLAALASVTPILLDHVLPLLDACVDVAAIESWVNGADRDRLILSSFSQIAAVGIVAAHLANRARFEEVFAEYASEMERRGFPERSRQRFDRIGAHLRQLQQSGEM